MSDRPCEPLHFAYIDAVRGFAFLGVLCVHCAGTCGYFPGSFLALQGGYGVQLFFLASAITLCYSTSTRREGRMACVNFYLRRFFRIAPLFWVSMIFYWAVPGSLPYRWLDQWAPVGVHNSYFLLTALFLHGWHPYTFNSIVPGGWSIAVEMTFYLVFPLCFYYITTLRKAALWLSFGVVLTLAERFAFNLACHRIWPDVHDQGVEGFFGEYWFPSQFTVFLTGIFVYFLLKEPGSEKIYKDRFWACWLWALCAAFLINIFHHDSNGFLSPFLIVLLLSGIVFSMAGHALTLLVNPIICYLGKVSYSCYLTHFAAIAIIIRFFHWLLPEFSFTSSSGAEIFDAGSGLRNLGLFASMMLTTLILTAVFSTLTYHLIESPGIALGRTVVRRLNARVSQGAGAK